MLLYPLKSFQFDFSLTETKNLTKDLFHEILLYGKLTVPEWELNAENRLTELMYAYVRLAARSERETENREYLHRSQFGIQIEVAIAHVERSP